MCELDILHDSLYQFCPELHLKRLNSLTLACHALLECKTLTLTELGRNLPTKARTKHNIKRIDRLLGNRHLHKERLAVYRWHASFNRTIGAFCYSLRESVSAFRAMFKGGS
ncbi:hypothetical protein VTH8203_03155 [Vibrio thalassae]|uniref:IS4 family transposase n=1 Tax=Vibrio thalassae TaxID=1243014 RepID=A0A240ELE8_9VIBR|nr:hypothetical protein VTH8203_03155 [Vibrio thalassae]